MVVAPSFETCLRFGVFRIVDFRPVVPILGLLGLWILDLFGRKEVPIFLQGARLHLLVVNFHFVRLVRPQDQCVEVCKFIVLMGTSGGTKL